MISEKHDSGKATELILTSMATSMSMMKSSMMVTSSMKVTPIRTPTPSFLDNADDDDGDDDGDSAYDDDENNENDNDNNTDDRDNWRWPQHTPGPANEAKLVLVSLIRSQNRSTYWPQTVRGLSGRHNKSFTVPKLAYHRGLCAQQYGAEIENC